MSWRSTARHRAPQANRPVRTRPLRAHHSSSALSRQQAFGSRPQARVWVPGRAGAALGRSGWAWWRRQLAHRRLITRSLVGSSTAQHGYLTVHPRTWLIGKLSKASRPQFPARLRDWPLPSIPPRPLHAFASGRPTRLIAKKTKFFGRQRCWVHLATYHHGMTEAGTNRQLGKEAVGGATVANVASAVADVGAG